MQSFLRIKSLVILFAGLFFTQLNAVAQVCDCKSLITSAIDKIESSYAGYPYKISRVILSTKRQVVDFSKKETSNIDCLKLLFTYISLFKEKHILLSTQDSIASNIPLTSLPRNHFLNGIWYHSDGSYSLEIKRSGKSENYIATVKSTTTEAVKKGQVIAEVYKSGKQYLIAYADEGAIYFTTLKSKPGELTFDLINKYIRINNPAKHPFEKLSAKTDFKIVNDSIGILYLPRFSQKAAAKIKLFADSIRQNISVKHLIIDVRNNPGGDPDVYYPLRPLYYTKPLYFPSLSFRVSKEMRMLDSLNGNELFDSYKNLPNGNFYSQIIDSIKIETAITHIKKIYLLTNRFTGSSAEVFVKEIMQSGKTIIAGETTNGVVDYFRATPFPLCNEKATLQIPLGKLLWEKSIDLTGISPQLHLSGVSTDWVDYLIQKVIKAR